MDQNVVVMWQDTGIWVYKTVDGQGYVLLPNGEWKATTGYGWQLPTVKRAYEANKGPVD